MKFQKREIRLESQDELFQFALHYCSRREASRTTLRRYFARKFREPPLPEDWIQFALDKCERLQVIDHARYAEILMRTYRARGKGKTYILQKLKEKGLEEQASEEDFGADDELKRAIEMALKTMRRANIIKIENPFQKRQKVLHKLVTLGFSFDIAKKALEEALELQNEPE